MKYVYLGQASNLTNNKVYEAQEDLINSSYFNVIDDRGVSFTELCHMFCVFSPPINPSPPKLIPIETLLSDTGLKNDEQKADLGLIPLCALEECAKAFMLGEKKYSRYNFTNGIEVNRLLAAALRHINQAIWESEKDKESNEMHLGHAMASLSMAIFMIKNKPELDNRYINFDKKRKEKNKT